MKQLPGIVLLCTCISTNLPLWGGVPKGRVILEMLRKPMAKTSSIPRTKLRAYMYAVGTDLTPAKKNLNAHLRYRKEIQSVGQLYDHVRHTSFLSSDFPHLRHEVETTIINKTLRKNLLSHLERGQSASLLNELENYYHLSPEYLPSFHATTAPAETFARNTLSYLQNHPHKPNWPLRYVLKTEGIDPVLKEEIHNTLIKQTVEPNQIDHALQLLQTAYEQYQRILKQSTTDESVQATVAIYEHLTKELETFTRTHRRRPMFQETNEQERHLFNLLSVLAYNHEANCFEQVIPHLYKLYELLEQFPSPHYGERETLKEVTRFVEQYDDLPQSVHMRDFLNPRPQEDLLYESMLYWKRNSPKFQQAIDEFILRRTTKTEYLPRPFNYY